MAEELEQIQEENIQPNQAQDVQMEQVEQVAETKEPTQEPPSKASQLYSQLLKEGYTEKNLYGGEQNFINKVSTKEGASKLFAQLKGEGYSDKNLYGGESNFINTLVQQPPVQKKSPLYTPQGFIQQQAEQEKKQPLPVKPSPKKPATFEESVTKDKEEKGSRLGYIYNGIMSGIGKLGSAASDFTMQMLTKVLPDEAIGGTGTSAQNREAALKQWRRQVEPDIRKATEKLAGVEVSEKNKEKYDNEFFTSSVRGLAESAPMMLGFKGSGLLLGGFDAGLESINNTKIGDKLPESTKTIFAFGVGTANAALEKIGIDKIFGKQSKKVATNLAVRTMSDLVSKSAVPITTEVFEKALTANANNIKNKILKAGGKIGEAGITEFLTGATQEGVNILGEEILNKSQKQQVFEPTDFGQKINRVLYAGAQEAVGGGIMGGLSLPFSKTRNYISEKVSEAKTPEDINNLKNEIATQAQKQNLSKNEFDATINLVDQYAKIHSSIPEGVANKTKVAEKIIERDELQDKAAQVLNEAQNLDPAFQEQKIEEAKLLTTKADEIHNRISGKPVYKIGEQTVDRETFNNYLDSSAAKNGDVELYVEQDDEMSAKLEKLGGITSIDEELDVPFTTNKKETVVSTKEIEDIENNRKLDLQELEDKLNNREIDIAEHESQVKDINDYYDNLKKQYDTKNIAGIPSEIGRGQEPIQTQPIQGGGTQEIGSGGVLQENVPIGQGEVAETTQGEIEKLRAEEQAEYAAMANPKDKAKRQEIYDKYDKLITPLLKQTKNTVEPVETTTNVNPKEGDTVELPSQVKGGIPRTMVFNEGEWKQQVGGKPVGVGEGVRQQAQTAFQKTTPVAEAPVPKTKTEQVGEGLLSYLGIPLEPKKPSGKKAVNISNKSELAELESKTQGEKKTIIQAAKKAIATLKSVFPDMEIYIHEDADSYNEVMRDEVGGVQNSRGNFAFEKDANGNPTGVGRIDINLSNAKDTTVAHEITHAVLLKAFGDNPALFKTFRDRMSKILSEDLNKEVTAFENLYKGQAVAPEEYLTELSALLSRGGETVEYKPSTLRKIAALINEYVSKITGGKFQPFKSEADFKNFVDFLNQVAGAIREGDVIKGLNTQEAYSNGASISVPNPDTFVAKKVTESVKSKSQIADYKFPDNIEILKTANLPVKNLTDLVRQYEGRVVIITSDATGYGVDKNGDPIFGGFGFSANAKNVNDGIGFASVSIGTVKGTYTAAEKAYGEGKSLVLVMIQPPHTTINNSYGSKYIIRGIKEIASQSKEELSKTKEAIKDFIKNSTAIQNELKNNEASLKRGSEKRLIELIDSIDENTDLDAAVEEFIADTTFTIRKELGKGIILENKDIRTNKSTNYAKIALNNVGYNIFGFLKEYGDNTFLTDDIILNNTGGFVVGGFELDILPTEQREKLISDIQSKGIVHPLFNAKLPGSNHFKLDGLYDVQENFAEYVRPETTITLDQAERDKLVRKYYKEDKFYKAEYRSIPLRKRTYTQLTIPAKTEFKEKYLRKKGYLVETIPNIGTKVAKGEGFIPKPGAAEQMAKATYVSKSQKDAVDDKLNKAVDYKKESGTTQVATTTGSYEKAAKILKGMGIDSDVLDYGAGLGLGSDAMSKVLGFDVDSFEPNSERWKGNNQVTFKSSSDINKKYNSVVSLNVLNVVEKDIRDSIVKDIYNNLKDGGTAVISTIKWSGDVNQAKNAVDGGEKNSLYITRTQGGKEVKVFQKGFDGNELVDYIKDLLGDKVSVQKNNAFGAAGVVIKKVGEGMTSKSQVEGTLDGKPTTFIKHPEDLEVINGFYSPIEKRLLETKATNLSANKWKEVVGRGDEAKFTGVLGWLESLPPTQQVSKSEIQNWMKDNRIEISEVVKEEGKKLEISKDEQIELGSYIKRDDLLGFESMAEAKKAILESDNWVEDWDIKDERFIELGNKYRDSFKKFQEEKVRYKDYQLPGEKSNYKEVLVTLPSTKKVSFEKFAEEYYGDISDLTPNQLKLAREQYERAIKEESKGRAATAATETKFKSSHYDEPNILAHIRMNTRVDAEGKKVLHIEEFQSDWGQKGREEGFKRDMNEVEKKKINDIKAKQQSILDKLKSYNLLKKITEGRLVDMREGGDYNKITTLVKVIGQKISGVVDNPYYDKNDPADVKKGTEIILKELDNALQYWFRENELKISKEDKLKLIEAYNEDVKSGVSKDRDYKKLDALKEVDNLQAEIIQTEFDATKGDISQAPFVTKTTDWTKLAWKVALKEAIKEGADKITWTTGEQQNERYNLKKDLNHLDYWKNDNGTYGVTLDFKKPQEFTKPSELTEKELTDYFGKEIATKIVSDSSSPTEDNPKRLEGDDLAVGGKGMIGFYGSPSEGKIGIVGEVAKALFKQEPKTTELNGEQQNSIDITPEMREKVQTGLPMFSKSQKPQIKDYIENQRKAGVSDEDIRAGIELVASKVGLSNDDIDALMGGEVKAEVPVQENAFEKVPKTQAARTKYFESTFGENAERAEEIYNKYKDTNDFDSMQKEMQGEKVKGKPAIETVGITKKEIKELAAKYNIEIDDRREAISDSEIERMAKELISNGYDVDGLVTEALGTEKRPLTDIEANILAEVAADMKAKIDVNSSNADIQKYRDVLSALNKGISENARGLRMAKVKKNVVESIADVMADIMEDNLVDELTTEQRKEAEKRFNEIKEALDKETELRKQAEAEIDKLKAELKVEQEKNKSKDKPKKAPQEFKVEKESIIKSIKDKWQSIISGTKPSKMKSKSQASGQMLDQLMAIAPEINKLIKGYIENGIATTLDDVKVQLKKDIEDAGITLADEDLNELVAGNYNKKKKDSKRELNRKLYELKQEQKLLLEIEKLEAGEVPTTEKKKIQKNQKLAELRKKIKELTGKELPKKETKEKTEDEKFAQYVNTRIKANEKRQAEIQEKIDNEDYEPEEKKESILENTELQKRNKALYDKYLDSVLNKDEKLLEYEKKRVADKMKNRGKLEKLAGGLDVALTTAKGTVAMFDQSVYLVQMLPFTLSHPYEAAKYALQSLKYFADKTAFDKTMATLHSTELWKLIEKSGLVIYEPRSAKADLRNELYGGEKNLWNKEVEFRGKKYSIGQAFERSTTSALNNARIYLFMTQVQDLYNAGKTFENAPKDFEAAARAVNELTGHGKLAAPAQMVSKFLGGFIWSAKMFSSTLNLAGLGDLVRPVATANAIARKFGIKTKESEKYTNKGFYTSLTPEQGKFVAKEMARFIGTGIMVMLTIKLASIVRGDDEDEVQIDVDPTSSGFGSIKTGDKTFVVYGRFGSAVRTVVQALSGKKTVNGEEQDLGQGYGSKTSGDVVFGSFVRGKATPAAGLAYDFFLNNRKNYYTKEELTPKTIGKQMLVPMAAQDMAKDFDRDGFLLGTAETVAKLYGANIRDDRDFIKKEEEVFTEEDMTKNAMQMLKEYSVEVPKFGTIEKNKIEVDKNHPEAGQYKNGTPYALFTTEEFEKYNKYRKDYIIKGLKVLYRLNKSGDVKLTKQKLEERLTSLKSQASKIAKMKIPSLVEKNKEKADEDITIDEEFKELFSEENPNQ